MSSRPRRAPPNARLVAAIALGCFVAGAALSELAHRRGAPAAVAPAEPSVEVAPPPKILFDPASIALLPDASLTLTLPPGFDAGAR